MAIYIDAEDPHVEGAIYVLRVESITSRDVVKPWVARLTGISERYGLARSFVRPLMDWSAASVSRAGVARGMVPTFPLRTGWVIEYQLVGQRGYVMRKFARVTPDGLAKLTPAEALAWAALQPAAADSPRKRARRRR